MRRIYMDANATTPVLPEVVAAMQPFWADRFGNASAVHGHGRGARGAIDAAREQVAALIGGKASEITFTSGGTESDNLALFGQLQPDDHLIISAIEHDAVLHAADALETTGIRVSRIACDANGVVDPAAISAALRENTKLVSVMLANNETGAIQPLREIAEITHAAGALLHTDAVQAGGKLSVDVQALRCDLLSLSAHKMHGPQGVGALWMRSGLKLRPMMHGGSHERQRRAGTENVPGIVGFGAAAAITRSWLAENGAHRLAELRDRLESSLLERIENVAVNSGNVDRLPNTASLRFAGVNAEELVIALDLQGLAISGGSACQSGAIEPSHVLRAMGMNEHDARSSVRFSLSRLTTEDEVDAAVATVSAAVTRLRSL
ncbi:cysteine desulfurase family protein [Terriglobus roseus DSM 18391]|uniref:cysteine desulfurase n=1 Tax=Terriglobus roseus (strain DSM 18391 / NRRL B-41598 / KBS 63) TaxID=926566 RepID=I3ZKK0_TERRK|nr:cysteine desulfurase family protein [Terriglobus roseus]AFL89768.1 cysteine desulfurase family protein [Terriglobus roseus DSM 18391]